MSPPASPNPPILAPSILSADFSRLREEVEFAGRAGGWIHCDVMDDHFVPNLTFGPLVVEAVNRLTDRYLDVHLMVTDPISLLDAFVRAGADGVTLHLEAAADPGAALDRVRRAGVTVGLALKPGTSLESASPWLDRLDLLLVMTVEPGFGGQAFMPDMLGKVRAAAAERARRGLGFRIEVDGGIMPETAAACRQAGADVFVAGNSLFHAPDRESALRALARSVGAGEPVAARPPAGS
jgi:ribulose-phosphate 3-epimerase